MKTDLEVLEGALELISEDGGWTQGEFCRDAKGNGVTQLEMGGASYCLEGAIRYAAGHWMDTTLAIGQQVNRLENLVRRAVPVNAFGCQSLAKINDHLLTSQEEAILCLKTALAELPD